MKKICFVAQFPPPIHGLSKAVDTLYKSQLKDEFAFKAINITSNKAILSTLWNILTVKTDAFYFTISQSKGGLWRDIALMALMEMRQKPVIIHLHGGRLRTLMDRDCSRVQRWLGYKLISKAACCIALGKSLRYIFQGIIDEKRIAVVPNCVDDEYMMPLNILENKIRAIEKSCVLHILYLSNFIATKGYREVLETAKCIKDRCMNTKFKFHFAGKFFEPAERTVFETYIKDNHLQEIVAYHGIVDGEEKRQLLRQCNILMLLTRYPKEGQPISILEAMGNGMAIVTTQHAGIQDIATVKNGFICPTDDIDIMLIANYLEHCYNDRTYLINTCKSNYDEIASGYTQSQYIENMKGVFNVFIRN